MSLRPGSHLGHYEIVASLGAGAMGEVYRARDARLGRDVALKILPEGFDNDPERLARFQREARTLASLNHAHVAQVHGFEQIGAARVLVLECVDGEDLAQRLARGALPVDEAISVARQIAAGIEAAHEAGIVHRDLKPANIKVRPDGQVKVLDFGLAKAMHAHGAAPSDPAVAPTLASPAMTLQGAIVGTTAYMAPEQARGRPVDKRADIWAFGVVLYEMLTGRRAFGGMDVSETLAAVLRDTPALDALPAETPPAVRRLLVRCLERDPSRRLRDIGEARVALDERGNDESPSAQVAVASRSVTSVPGAGAPDDRLSGSAASRQWLRGPRLPLWSLAAVAAASLAVAGWSVLDRANDRAARAPRVQHFEIVFPRYIEPSYSTEGGVSISPDGMVVAVTGWRNGRRTVFLRRLDGETVTEIPRNGISGSAFSPDSTRVAFLVGGQLHAYAIADGEIRTLASNVDVGGGLAWGDTGVVFTRAGALWILPVEGGAARQLTSLDAAREEVAHTSPTFLPGGRTLLFSTFTPYAGAERIEAVPAAGGPRAVVLERATSPVWSPTGHLLFMRDGVVLATAWDATSGTARGTPTPIFAAGRVAAGVSATTALRVSLSGTLLFVPASSLDRRLVSVGRDGSALSLDLPASNLMTPRLSPDRRRVLVANAASTIEAWHLERRSQEPLSAPAPGTSFPVWSRDGSRVVFRRFNVPTVVRSDTGDAPTRVPGGTASDYPSAPGPDADTVLVTRVRPDSSGDIVLLSITGAFAPRPVVATQAYEGGAQISPDTRWIIYGATEAGRSVVQVRRYPSLDRRVQVSEGTGLHVRWSVDGREIYYRDGTSMMAVPFDGSGDEPILGKATRLFRDDYDFGQGVANANYDVTSDGRFLMLRREAQGGQVNIVLNWTDELKQILAKGGVR